jgi:hypothetical protein
MKAGKFLLEFVPRFLVAIAGSLHRPIADLLSLNVRSVIEPSPQPQSNFRNLS